MGFFLEIPRNVPYNHLIKRKPTEAELMKTIVTAGYKDDLADIAGGLNDLMADLEDIRDEAQELLDEKEDGAVREDVRKMDEALKKLSEAADLLDQDEA
jgi:hypothetical protein